MRKAEPFLSRDKKKERKKNSHTGNTVLTIASNMKPSTRGNKSSIPTLKHLVRVG